MGLSGYLSSGAELGNMTGKAILSLLGTLIEEVGISLAASIITLK